MKLLPLVQVHVSLLADDVGEATANTGDDGKGVHNLAGSVNVSIKNTQNVLEIGTLDKIGLKVKRH